MKDFKLYKVGGCVRDEILGVKSKDIDFSFEFISGEVLTLSPEVSFNRMNEILKVEGFEIFLETPSCFTTRARFPKDHENSGLCADFVMCRKEVYNDPESRQPTVLVGNLYEDLQRRDFTVNAIAQDENGILIDPFNGRKDLKEMILKCPIDAETSFMDDPLRMLRALRFMVTKNFRVDEDIAWMMFQHKVWVKFDDVVSRERVREELYKMFHYDTIRSLKILSEYVPQHYVTDYIFKGDMWLKPTTEKK